MPIELLLLRPESLAHENVLDGGLHQILNDSFLIFGVAENLVWIEVRANPPTFFFVHPHVLVSEHDDWLVHESERLLLDFVSEQLLDLIVRLLRTVAQLFLARVQLIHYLHI